MLCDLLDVVADREQKEFGERGARLYVGLELEGLKRTDDPIRRISVVRPLSVQTHRAAAMFYMNIQTWKNQPFVKENYQASDIEALEGDLQQLATRTQSEMEIQWGLKQIVFERV